MSNRLSTYYRDHWVNVEPERMARYEAMFQWRESHEALVAPAQIRTGLVVADYGCGPGALSIELARRVGSAGRVFALDINAEFLARTEAAAVRAGFQDRVEALRIENERIPLADASVDRVVCKNVLEYVTDPERVVGEFRRVLRGNGLAHATDSDWGTVLLEPHGERFEAIMAAASVAFRTPRIGRKLHGIFRRAGFADVRVQVLASPDTTGALRPVIANMASYARLSGRLDDGEIDAFLADVDRSIADGSYFALLPQFLVTGYVSQTEYSRGNP